MIPNITSLKRDNDDLIIGWSDGAEHRVPAGELRRRCPCALCRAQPTAAVSESTGTASANDRPEVRIESMTPLGNYAYAIHFSDGHTSGIFPLELLRQAGEELNG